MKARTKGLLASAVVIAAVVIAGVLALLQRLPSDTGGLPPSAVPASWQTYRESPGHLAHVGQRNLACKECHAFEDGGFVAPGDAPCARCHTEQKTHAHGGAHAEGIACTTCHAFAPGREAKTCQGCHTADGDAGAHVSTHATAPCETCHAPHRGMKPEATNCAACHADKVDGHARGAHGARGKGAVAIGGELDGAVSGRSETSGCSACHAPHTPAKQASNTCSNCHAGVHPGGGEAHRDCTNCHKPHDFAARVPDTCKQCHADTRVLADDRVDKHAVCTNCHAPHDFKATRRACTNCHADVHVGHAGHDDCTTCHRPHNAPPTGLRSGTGTASGCTQCHSALASKTTVHAKGLGCQDCHARHAFSKPASPGERIAVCARCHGEEVRLASTNRGHSNCATCHGSSAHTETPTATPACGSCHTREASSAPAGHAACKSCHQPHDGARKPTAACASCHSKESGSRHGSAVSGGCATCHRPHGPGGVASPPACATCHARATLPALHAASGHANCANCHTSHGPPRADRETCTTGCHADRRTHQPQATRCSGCHAFRR